MPVSETEELHILSKTLHEKGLDLTLLYPEIDERIKNWLVEKFPHFSGKKIEIFRNQETFEVKVLVDGINHSLPELEQMVLESTKDIFLSHLADSSSLPGPEPEIQINNSGLIAGLKAERWTIFKWLAALFFYLYHLFYLCGAVFTLFLLFNAEFREPFINSFRELGVIRGLLLAGLMTVPLIAIEEVFRNKIWKQEDKITKLFILIEIPVLFLLYFFSFSDESINPTFAWFSVLLLFIPVYTYLAVFRNSGSFYTKLFGFITLFLNFVVVSYFTIIYSFLFPGWVIGLIKSFGSMISPSFRSQYYTYSIWDGASRFLGLSVYLFFLLLALAVLLIPYLFSGVLGKVVFDKFKNLLQSEKSNLVLNTIAGSLAVFLIVTFVVSYQPDKSFYINKLNDFYKSTDFDTREKLAGEIVSNKKQVEEAIDYVYMARTRYLFGTENEVISNTYSDPGGKTDTGVLKSVLQQIFNLIAYPFIYQGPPLSDYNILSTYEYIFAENYEKPSDDNTDTAVELAKRTVKVESRNDALSATVIVEEEYISKSARDEEVIYEFSLPDASVITQLKLGPNLEFEGAVAPRGAAQKTYQQEVNRFRDPALLEQTGPRQYRLRIFPIPSKNSGQPNQKIQFSYLTLLDSTGYGLPVYSRESNINVKKVKPSISLNGQQITPGASDLTAVAVSFNAEEKICDTTSEILISSNSLFASASAYLNGPANSRFYGNPLICKEVSQTMDKLKNQRIALLVDTSMENKGNKHIDEVQVLLRANPQFVMSNAIDFYKFNDTLSAPLPLTAENSPVLLSELTYFGTSDWIKSFDLISQNYDYYIVIAANPKTPVTTKLVNIHPSKMFVLFKDQKIPALNGNPASEYIAKNVRFFNRVEDVFKTMVKPVEFNQYFNNYSYIEFGPYWQFTFDRSLGLNSGYAPSIKKDEPLSVMLSKAFVYDQIRYKYLTDYSNTYFIDASNRLAQDVNIVTPFSSMIALINETQKQNLQNFSLNSDRYEQSTNSFNISAPRSLSIPGAALFGTQSNNLMLPAMDSGVRTNSVGISPSVMSSGFTPLNILLSAVPLLIGVNLVIVIPGVIIYFAIVRRRRLKKQPTRI